MRIVIFGAGAVGSVIGGRLFQHADAHGHDVIFVARGPHRDAIRSRGLTINDPSGSVTIRVPVVERIDEVPLDPDDVVLLTMKSQDTRGALEQLVRHAPSAVNVVCAQNGVENERLALRLFRNVYAVCVMLPAGFMEPGVVDASGGPHNAILDIGRYPTGADVTSEAIAQAFVVSDLASRSCPDIMRWKYAKLMMNLANASDALVSDTENIAALVDPARREGAACLDAAGIDRVHADEDRARRAGVMEVRPIAGRPADAAEAPHGRAWPAARRPPRSTG